MKIGSAAVTQRDCSFNFLEILAFGGLSLDKQIFEFVKGEK